VAFLLDGNWCSWIWTYVIGVQHVPRRPHLASNTLFSGLGHSRKNTNMRYMMPCKLFVYYLTCCFDLLWLETLVLSGACLQFRVVTRHWARCLLFFTIKSLIVFCVWFGSLLFCDYFVCPAAQKRRAPLVYTTVSGYTDISVLCYQFMHCILIDGTIKLFCHLKMCTTQPQHFSYQGCHTLWMPCLLIHVSTNAVCWLWYWLCKSVLEAV